MSSLSLREHRLHILFYTLEEPEILRRIRSGERVAHFETVRRRKDGTLLDISLTISPIRDLEGKIIGASKIARDITEAKKAETARHLLSAIVDSSDDAIISKDLNGVITSWNKSAERLFGYNEADAVGKPVTMLMPEDRVSEEPEILRRIRSGERVDHFETIRRRKDGTLLDISLTISPIRDAAGNIIGASKIARDITERKRIDEEIRRANRDLEQFAFSASHDLQEPLRAVRIYSELLMRRHSEEFNGNARQYLEYVHRGAARMESLVQDLLAYTRASKCETEFVETPADEALTEALDVLAEAIATSNAAITQDPLPTVRINRGHLQQVFQNLVGNAIKYRHPNRTPMIHVGATSDARAYTFFVRDNGIGIATDYKEAIFELFRRLDTSEEYSGTGIGLALCQRILERYKTHLRRVNTRRRKYVLLHPPTLSHKPDHSISSSWKTAVRTHNSSAWPSTRQA